MVKRYPQFHELKKSLSNISTMAPFSPEEFGVVVGAALEKRREGLDDYMNVAASTASKASVSTEQGKGVVAVPTKRPSSKPGPKRVPTPNIGAAPPLAFFFPWASQPWERR